MLGDTDAARAAAVELRPFIDTHPASVAAVFCFLLQAYLARAEGYARQAVDLIEKAVAANSNAYWLAQCLLYFGAFQFGVDRFDEAQGTLDRARTQLERLGFATLMQEYHWYLALLHFMTGRWDDALAEMVTTRHLTEEMGASGVRATVGGDPTPLINLHRGDVAGAADALAAIEVDPTLPASSLARVTWVEPMRILVQDGAGQPQAALRTLETWREIVHSMAFLPDYRGLPRALVRVCRTQGRHTLLDQIVEEAAVAARRAGDVPSVTGTALLLQGMVADNPEGLVEAVEVFRASPRLFERAEACAEAAVSLLACGRDGEGRALLTEAFDLYGEMGATRPEAALAAEVRRFGIRRGTRGRRQRPVSGWPALTATEGRIVGLVAQGLTNGEIGDRLYISRGTVATHLRSVFRKVEVSSRAELAAEAARHPTGTSR